MTSTGSFRAGLALAALGLLSACAASRAVPPSPGPAAAPALLCLEALGRRGAAFEPVAERASAGGCRLVNGVSLRQTAARIEPPATMTCPLALALADFEARVVQPAAQRHFGRRVAAIRNWGAYSCRMRSGDSRRLSEHALGQAIDIFAFDLAGGTRIAVRDHWRERGPRGRFLREVARGACAMFSVVLTPKSDAAHADHLHLDIGPNRLCDA